MADVIDSSGKKIGTTPASFTPSPNPTPAGVYPDQTAAFQEARRLTEQAELQRKVDEQRQLELDGQVHAEFWGLIGKYVKPLPAVVGLGALGLFLGWAFTPRCSK